MQRKVTFAILAIFVCIFVVSFDRWGRRALLGFVLSSFNLSKDYKNLELSELKIKDFPENFMIGSSSSAYQIEGAWDEEGNLISKNSYLYDFFIFNFQGKTPSIWDDFVHFHPHSVDDNSTGDISADSYHNWKQDIQALKLVGVRKNCVV